MNTSEQLTYYFNQTKKIYINIALLLGLIIIFIILDPPISDTLKFIIKIIIIMILLYLIYENIKKNLDFIKILQQKDNKIFSNIIILSNIVNLALIILLCYLWYILFF